MIARDFLLLLVGVVIGCPIGLALSVLMSLNAVQEGDEPKTG